MSFGNIRKSAISAQTDFRASSDLRQFARGLKSAHRNLSADLQHNAPRLSREARRAFVAMLANDVSAPIALQQFSRILGCALVSGSSHCSACKQSAQLELQRHLCFPFNRLAVYGRRLVLPMLHRIDSRRDQNWWTAKESRIANRPILTDQHLQYHAALDLCFKCCGRVDGLNLADQSSRYDVRDGPCSTINAGRRNAADHSFGQ